MTKDARPSLESKKDLILHTYDSFLVNQTRLYVQSCSNTQSESHEINRRRELLVLDDLIGFAIAARRLVELTGLKSFANRCNVPLAYLDDTEEPYQVMKLKNKSIGFHTLMNRLIHASFVEHIHDMMDFVLLVRPPQKEIRDKIIWNRIFKKYVERLPMEQLLLVSTDSMNPVIVSMEDMLRQSIFVAEKIIDACSDNQIFLELNMRGAD